ncbi:anaerobic nitric oxide reductase flavorubredoxin [Desulfoluna sp.]|uniref:anaerobic nitric oxide reductase flavorubredoxin n=1 Tax=Desulfoluna sp. TaxID=2045199 RepID=UPI002605721A|nr:anaerobic nitric oxide reductase flavorubredoxin [Desulfoluna sp.]
MHVDLNDHVTWVGVRDWELRKFHGEEYSTHRGSTYNAYLVRDEKTVLIDTVWLPFAKQFIEQLIHTVDLKEIDYLVMNHGVVDHSGALPELMRHIPDVPIYCTKKGVASLKGQYHQEWNFQVVKTGDRLSLGKRELIFIEAPMLHWPDSMFTYLTENNILFSNDAFGQHYATSEMFNDLVDPAELYQECLKYYANILTPFSPMVTRKINEVLGFNLPVDMICPSHGVLWRDHPEQIIHSYLKWAEGVPENQITVVYDTMWENTRKMADAIVEGIQEADPEVSVKVINVGKGDKNDVITDVFQSKGVIVGSSTINRGILTSVAGFLEEVKGLQLKGKQGGAFGSYGWSGESVKQIREHLKSAGFRVEDEGVAVLWTPDADGVEACRQYGRTFAEGLKG